MAREEYTIAALWMEGPLSYLEQLCLKSFIDAGHHVRLYHYGPLQNVPDGIELASADDILPRTDFLQHNRTGSPALHSDLFRYRLLSMSEKTIWADTDAYCALPFRTKSGHFYGWESDVNVNGGVLGLPQDSDTLGALLEYTRDEFAIPSWYGEKYQRKLQHARDAGQPVHASEQPWGVWGPHALTHFLHETGEIEYAFARHVLYPFSFSDRREMLRPIKNIENYIKPDTASIHFYGRRVRPRLARRNDGLPIPGSVIYDLVKMHGIEPEKAPVPQPKGMQSEKSGGSTMKTANTTPSPLLNLSDLALEFGSDKGPSKHRYTELYQMLLHPFRDQPVNFMEMGLLIGGPEHNVEKDRETKDLPSIRMWLKFFETAQVHGLDISDFSWFEHERFTFHRCDMDKRENIALVAETLPKMDIILDDASHASHHQQYAFLELFDRLKHGGLYIIEDLRWQPPHMERPNFTKTAALFDGFQKSRLFEHSDKALQAELEQVADQISGCFVFQAKYNKKRQDQVAVIHKK
ncbi:hypothetical protein ACJ5NV_17825 [Loktanella agnita]|uniref:hypothetical protein n=1 Tax=Loktanella agnita TaxID=287097 RepID=UPI00398A3CEA